MHTAKSHAQSGFSLNYAPRDFFLFAFVLVFFATGSIAQTVSLSTTSLTFGNVVVNTTSTTKNVTLTNTGTVSLSITSITTSGPFAQTNTCGTSVAAGKKCTISVTLTPTVTGAASGTVTISDNAIDSPQTITTSGTGVQDVTLSPSTLTFASRTVGTTSTPTSVTLTNNLSTSLSITSIATTGDFSQTNTCGTSLAGKAKCTISVSFTPAVVGTRTGTLTVTDGASSSPQTSSLTGTGSTAGLLSIAVTPANPSIQAGATQQFTATGTFSSGNTFNITQSVTWNSTKLTVATVSSAPGTQGLATGVSAGSATIRCASGKITGSTVLTVTSSATLQSITVTPAAPSIALGTGQQFTATGNYSDGSTQNLTASATWTSSATNVASISAAGLATSVATGSTNISATASGITGSTTLAVTRAALVSIAVTPTNVSVALGTTEQYKAVGTFTDGSTLDLTSTVTWSSSATSTASISNSPGTQGLATTLAVGSATISAISGSVSGSTSLTVTPAALTSIVVTPVLPSIPAGTTQQFTATGTFTDGTTQNVTGSVVWSSSATGIATISNASGSQGLASAAAIGVANITATSGTISASTSLTVTAAALVSIAVTPANQTLAPGTIQQFTATGTFTDNSTQDLTNSVTWSAGDLTVATISNTGLATTVADGTVTITATSGSVAGSTTLIVSGATLVSIVVSPSSASIPAGTTQQFSAIGSYSDNSTQDITSSVHWSSSDGTVATISNTPGTSGLATGVAAGGVVISATSGSVTGSADLTITTAALISIAVTPQSPSIPLGNSQQFTATGAYTDNSSKDLTQLATWSSSDNTVLTISNQSGSNGLAASAGAGTAVISAIYSGVSGMSSASVTGTALVSIAVTPGNSSIVSGATQQMTAIGAYTDGSSQNLTNSATWSSSNSSSATVSSTGLVTGAFVGNDSITATMNSISGTASITVTPIVRALGTVTSNGTTTCPSGSPTTATCTSVTVSCTGLPDLNATLVVALPTGTTIGTVILHAGGPGVTLLNAGFPTAYLNDGFRTVQVVWASDWVAANGAGAKSAACRVASIFQYVFNTVHLADRTKGFCGQGSSGGGAAFTYAIAHYAMDAYFDHLVIASGPGLSRMDYGCDGSLYQGPPLNLCSSLTEAPYIYATRSAQMFNNWEATTTCESASPTQSDITHWMADSIVTSGGNYTYPTTSMSWFTCTTQPVNESTGQGKFLIDQILAQGASPTVSCYSGVCTGEAVWNDPTAFNDTVNDMLTKCVPNHQQ